MKRRYTTGMFRSKIDLIRANMEHVFFGIDVIVGFPGETEELFMETYSFLESVKPAFIHIFPYSVRPNTVAAGMAGQVDSQVKDERVKRLEELSDRLHAEFYADNKGREEEVLFESTMKGGMMFGYTRNYIKVEAPYDREKIGKIVRMVI
jgi:threonylcarbamoyladenosine tRNA methylthiotransferase MtaB